VPPKDTGTGRPRRHRQRTLVDAILSLSMLRSGGALLPGRELPRDLLCWQTVSHSLRNSHVAPGWHLGADPNGPAAALSPARAARPRRGSRVPPAARANRSRPPACAVCTGRTDDGAKQLVGRRRHVLVDTEGLVIALAVHLADSIGRDGPRRHQAGARRSDRRPSRCRACSCSGWMRTLTAAARERGQGLGRAHPRLAGRDGQSRAPLQALVGAYVPSARGAA